MKYCPPTGHHPNFTTFETRLRMFELHSNYTIYCVKRAQLEAWRLGQDVLTTQLLILGLLHFRWGLSWTALSNSNADLSHSRTKLASLLKKSPNMSLEDPVPRQFIEQMKFSADLKQVFDISFVVREELGDELVEPIHLLIAITRLREIDPLADLGINLADLQSQIQTLVAAKQP